MKKQVKEPFFIGRMINLMLGIVILGLLAARIMMGSSGKILEIIIFALAAAVNFIAATIAFSKQKKIAGNLYAVLCAFFLVVAAVLVMTEVLFL